MLENRFLSNSAFDLHAWKALHERLFSQIKLLFKYIFDIISILYYYYSTLQLVNIVYSKKINYIQT